MHKGTLIVDVEPGSTPWGAGIRDGDRIVSVNGECAVDSLAVVYLLSGDESASMEFYSPRSGRFMVTTDNPEDFLASLEFESLKVHQCANDCIYCFCKQNPPGARRSFQLRDEDFRMSFLAGYYSTFSTITDEDLQRIVNHQLSPQYVTVPATDESVRERMLGREASRPILDVLQFLGEHGITTHVQTVICPGFNDGEVLRRTVSDLSSLGETVSSVALIPVGLTRFTKDERLRRLTTGEFREVLRLVYAWRHRRSEFGQRWLEAADEVYISLNRAIPGSYQYGMFPQLSSGVGMVRRFLDDIRTVMRRKKPAWWSRSDILMVSGMLFGPVLMKWIDRLNDTWGFGAKVKIASNNFFGSRVTVSGLLSAQDVISVLNNTDVPDILILPDDILDASGRRFVDDCTVDQLKEQTGIREILFASTLSGAISEVQQRTV
jgi:putative radical SAM enzyme (TIGR03279 family)